jgi:hypothetical protein
VTSGNFTERKEKKRKGFFKTALNSIPKSHIPPHHTLPLESSDQYLLQEGKGREHSVNSIINT